MTNGNFDLMKFNLMIIGLLGEFNGFADFSFYFINKFFLYKRDFLVYLPNKKWRFL